MPDNADLRIFVSSPADVRPERRIAERAIGRLAREYAYHLRIEPVLWERERLITDSQGRSRPIGPANPGGEIDERVRILRMRR